MFNLAVETVADKNKESNKEAQTMGGIFNQLIFARYSTLRGLRMLSAISKPHFGSMGQMRINTILQKKSLKQ